MITRLIFFFGLLFASASHAAEMVNVEYIHNTIQNRWGITVPYNPSLTNPRVAANMKYLLTAVDRANEIINDKDVTNHGDNPNFATLAAADTVATNDAIDRLIQQPFIMTTTADTTVFSFELSAQGKFFITWGDGTTQTITRTDTKFQTYSHTYARAAPPGTAPPTRAPNQPRQSVFGKTTIWPGFRVRWAPYSARLATAPTNPSNRYFTTCSGNARI